MRIKKLWTLYPVLVVIFIIVFFEGKWRIESKEFVSKSINSKIVKKNNNWTGGRSYDYKIRSGETITMMEQDSIKLGDSISKDANSYEFEIFRKNKFGVYEFYKKYQYED